MATTTRNSTARWQGDLPSGSGEMTIGDGVWTGAYTFASRFEAGDGTNPEELLGAAHAGCFSMSLANILAQEGHDPESVETAATVHLGRDADDKPAIVQVALSVRARVSGLDEAAFRDLAQKAKVGCPVSKLFDTEITLDATLA